MSFVVVPLGDWSEIDKSPFFIRDEKEKEKEKGEKRSIKS